MNIEHVNTWIYSMLINEYIWIYSMLINEYVAS